VEAVAVVPAAPEAVDKRKIYLFFTREQAEQDEQALSKISKGAS
jgi:hypothetical protein